MAQAGIIKPLEITKTPTTACRAKPVTTAMRLPIEGDVVVVMAWVVDMRVPISLGGGSLKHGEETDPPAERLERAVRQADDPFGRRLGGPGGAAADERDLDGE
jgi:hypothetical protein